MSRFFFCEPFLGPSKKKGVSSPPDGILFASVRRYTFDMMKMTGILSGSLPVWSVNA